MSLWSRLFRGSAGDQYQKGIEYFNEGNYDEAVRCLEQVVADEKGRQSPIAKNVKTNENKLVSKSKKCTLKQIDYFL